MNQTSSSRSYTGTLLGLAGLSAIAVLAAERLVRSVPRKRYDLHGKTVLITGGSRGFGLAIAEEFGKAGARVALCARDEAELEKARAQLQAKRIEAKVFPVDLTQASLLEGLLESVQQSLGSIDILVNDAGAISVSPLESLNHSDFEDAMNLMFWAPVNLTLAALPRMKNQGRGQIINIASVGGRVSIPHLLPYSCAKFALVGFSTGLSAELAKDGINVLTVVPGLMRTGSYLNADFKGVAKQEFAWFGLLGNLPGFSVAASFAARAVRESLERQEQNCTISLPAKILIALEALAPDVNRFVFALANRFALPGPAHQHQAVKGKTLNPALNVAFQAMTALGKLAAQRFNE